MKSKKEKYDPKKAVYWEEITDSKAEYGNSISPLLLGFYNGKCRLLGYVWYTPIRQCERCGKISTPKKIQFRSLAWTWNMITKEDYYKKEMKGMLCMSCWNKVRPIVKAKEEADQIKKLSNKLKREITKCQKLKHQDN